MPAALRKLIVGALLVLGLVYFALVRDDASEDGLVLWSIEEAEAAEAALGAPGLTSDSAASGEPAPPIDGERVTLDEVGDRPQVVFGRVLRANGEDLGNVEVRRAHPYLSTLTARADASGRFQMNVEAARGVFELVGEDWVLLGGRRHLEPELAEEYLLVAAPRGQIVGRVLDPLGAPLADVLVRLNPPSDALVPFGVATPPIELESWRIWTSAEGGFRFHEAPVMPGVEVEVEAPGRQPARAAVSFEAGRAELELRLEPLD
jgi:hypothetical protein